MLITQEDLKSILSYEVDTGRFLWLVKRCPSTYIGKQAGNTDVKGYVRIQLSGRNYLAHRLAWLYVYGKFADGDIDHIDGNPSNNTINNLRIATRSQNMQNQRNAQRGTKAGLLGVSWHARTNEWRSFINIDGKRKQIGTFKTPEDAHFAYVKEKRRLHEFCTI